MTVKDAQRLELDRLLADVGALVIPPEVVEECHVCHAEAELRCGVCFECQDICDTDRKEVWVRADPTQRWPYVWSKGHALVKKAGLHAQVKAQLKAEKN